ncbi:hypothetical protein HK102_004931 [Quaeritorhiza haematococci]|nr:hypothetical protein HK102_004931 [Quaeritorhiza haematococci]
MTTEVLSEYEQQRLANIARNQKVLEELGIVAPTRPAVRETKKSATSTTQKKKESSRKRKRSPVKEVKPVESVQDEDDEEQIGGRLRRSRRLRSRPPSNNALCDDNAGATDWIEGKASRSKLPPKQPRPNVFGEIPGVPVGKTWETRIQCSYDGIHRPTVAGIHGSETEGCYSLALSGGYEDDIDLGNGFTYTGEGGRDLKGTKTNPKNLRTAPQSKDQTLTKGNKALEVSMETGKPVRVIRGYKLDSDFAPQSGYRYDGLYRVEKMWYEKGQAGFLVFKYCLKRLPGQPPLPFDDSDNAEEDETEETEEKENVEGKVVEE